MDNSQIFVNFLGLLTAVSGPFIASFFALYVSRQHLPIVISSSRYSQCVNCHTRLHWYELIPIVSYILLRGKCRSCGNSIDIRNLLAELMGGAAFLMISIRIMAESTLLIDISPTYLLQTLIVIFFIGTMLYLAIEDIYTFSVPARFIYLVYTALFVVAICLNLLNLAGANQLQAITLARPDALAGGMLYPLVTYIFIKLSKQKSMGVGDVWITGLIGLVLGVIQGGLALYLAILLGGIGGIAYAILKKKFRGLIVPFVPFLLLGSALSIMIGTQLLFLIQ